MRWPCILASLLLGPAGAIADRAPPHATADGDFWREVVEPHADEVRHIVKSARDAMKIADDALLSDAEWAVDQRMRYFRDAYGMLRHARHLAPENAEVLALLGRAADELGQTREAHDALEAHLQLQGPDQASVEAIGRLGAICLRLGQRDAAIRYLRLAQAPLRSDTVQPLVHLANALAARGELPAAIDTLANVLPPRPISYYTQELTLASFSLALIYDRDEQRGAAFGVLERMKSTLQHAFGPQVLNALAMMRFAPSEDQYYYLALLYEALDQYPEARAQWALYAASGDLPWRARALDHIEAIDLQRRAAPASNPAAQPSPPPAIRRTVQP